MFADEGVSEGVTRWLFDELALGRSHTFLG